MAGREGRRGWGVEVGEVGEGVAVVTGKGTVGPEGELWGGRGEGAELGMEAEGWGKEGGGERERVLRGG